MVTVHVLRVFTGEDGSHGNELGVVLDGSRVRPEHRQELAAALGYPETVFVDDAERAVVRIYSPTDELPFAGHPLVGTAWLLARVGSTPAVLRPPAGEVPARADSDRWWIEGRPEWSPPWEHVQLDSATAVAALRQPIDGHDLTQFWAWSDESAGVVRARVFAARMGVPQDEACGSASLLLAAQLGRDLVVRHGEGSLIHVRPKPGGTVDVGGTVAACGTRTESLSAVTAHGAR
jgi:predicted PhzF superfamily epimerase YddE/YHI9